MKDKDKASRGKSSACFELSFGYENTAITKGREGGRERELKSNFLHLLCPHKKVKRVYLYHVTEGGEVVWAFSQSPYCAKVWECTHLQKKKMANSRQASISRQLFNEVRLIIPGHFSFFVHIA